MAKDKGSRRLYRIGEAASALKLKTCVLRFWEGEFPQLAPLRTPKGQRLYREDDMRVLRRIRSLLHEYGMTIDGARRVLSGEMPMPAPRRATRHSVPAAGPSESGSVAPMGLGASGLDAAGAPSVRSGLVPPVRSSALSDPSPALAARLVVPPAGRLALQASESLRALEDAARELRELRGILSGFPTPSSPEHAS